MFNISRVNFPSIVSIWIAVAPGCRSYFSHELDMLKLGTLEITLFLGLEESQQIVVVQRSSNR